MATYDVAAAHRYRRELTSSKSLLQRRQAMSRLPPRLILVLTQPDEGLSLGGTATCLSCLLTYAAPTGTSDWRRVLEALTTRVACAVLDILSVCRQCATSAVS